MSYYLIKEWHPHRGTTSEEPSCYFYASKIYPHPLTEIRADLAYTSRKRAERVAAKYNTLYTKAEVVEVPEWVTVK